MANPEYKKLFKTRVFRWQQMINDSNLGIRVEALESKNLTFKEQLDPETAFIYRRGLTKSDIGKDTFNLRVTNTVTLGGAEQ